MSGTIPAELGSLTILSYLFLGSNLLTGEIPTELGSLTYLEVVYISGNQLTGCIPDGLQGVVGLEGSLCRSARQRRVTAKTTAR